MEKDIWRVLEAKMMHYNSTFHQLLINDSHGWQNISSRPGNCQISVCSMVPERLADATPDALYTNNQLLGRQVPESNRWTDTHGTDYGILCKANRASLHYVLASFVLFHSVKPLKSPLLHSMYRMHPLKLITYACDL